MSAGAMFYAADRGALDAAFAEQATILPDDLISYLDASAHNLTNTAHSPAPFDLMIGLDGVLAAAGYPAEFRYARLVDDAASLRVERSDDLPLIGSISAAVVANIAVRARAEEPPSVTDPWEELALEELFRNVAAAAELGYALVGVYA